MSTFMASANGGEYRKSYHGFAPGHAVVVDSPTELQATDRTKSNGATTSHRRTRTCSQVTPMQIDTWNRDKMDIDGPLPPRFVPGPLPRASEAPVNPAYSGLLECPMTTRLSKAPR